MTTFKQTCIAAALLWVASSPALADDLPSAELEGVDVEEQLGDELPLDLEFVDHTGRTVQLGDYFDGERPVLFTLNYYACPMLCGLQLNAVADALKELDWQPGENYRVVTISFDAEETAALAEGKRNNYIDHLGGDDDLDWSFLVGDQESIDAITEAFGYRYHYVEESDEYAHPSVIMFATPDGVISRYLYGMAYQPHDVRLALLESSEGTIGTTVDRLILACFIYDPDTGQYVRNAFAIMRIGGAVTLILLTSLLAILWKRESKTVDTNAS